MKVVCTGGRAVKHLDKIHAALASLIRQYPSETFEFATGACPDPRDRLTGFSTDMEVERCVIARGFQCWRYEADWKTHGKSAGPKRNRWMLEHFAPNLVVVFPGGAGTADCRSAAEEAGIPVWVPYE